MQKSLLSFASLAFVLLLASCDTLCTSGDLVVENNTNNTIYLYTDDDSIGSVEPNESESFLLDSGDQLIEVEHGTWAPTLDFYDISVTGCGETELTIN
ncbi:MAG: hypothetical protein P8H59_05680 [Flavobacteriales bacterium]|nr:hypothetical protein [Flavobacteriales bacterium]MDG2245840.1 hypothetical protein [Flavobacteriales bacterium]